MICQEGPCHKEDHLFLGMDLMVIIFVVLTLVIRLWIVGSMEGEGLEAPMSQLDVGHAIKSDMLLPHVAQWDATPAVGLDTKPMNVPVKEVIQEGVLHTLQQEELVNLGRRQIQKILKIKRQEPTVKYILKDGEKKLIKKMMKVSPAQLGTGHATNLGTKLKIVGVPWDE